MFAALVLALVVDPQAGQFAVGAQLLLRDSHGAAGVDNEIDPRRHFLAIQADGEQLRTRIGRPVHVTEVVTRRIRTVILEFQRAARARTEALADSSSKRCPGQRKTQGGGGSHRRPINGQPGHCQVLPRPQRPGPR